MDEPASPQRAVILTEERLSELLHEAAAEGARLALHSVGLDDATAGGDIRDIRDTLKVWRDVRAAIFRRLFMWTFGLVLVAMSAIAYPHIRKLFS